MAAVAARRARAARRSRRVERLRSGVSSEKVRGLTWRGGGGARSALRSRRPARARRVRPPGRGPRRPPLLQRRAASSACLYVPLTGCALSPSASDFCSDFPEDKMAWRFLYISNTDRKICTIYLKKYIIFVISFFTWQEWDFRVVYVSEWSSRLGFFLCFLYDSASTRATFFAQGSSRFL